MSVSDQHKLYRKNIRRWELVRDCVEGSEAIKSRGGDDTDDKNQARSIRGTRYLPQPNPDDFSNENRIRYDQYKIRANFVNFTGHTKDGFLGMVYRKPPEVELNSAIDYLVDNADGQGLSLLQLLQGVTSDVLEVGRHGLLTDFPPSAGGTQAQTAGLKAKIVQYDAENIINWRTSIISSHTVLTLVVLVEEVEKVDDDGFSTKIVKWHRALLLKDGIYVQQLFDEDDKIVAFKDEDEVIQTDIVPRKADGSTWDEIPFTFVGSIDNSPTPDKAPLYDMAEINISHYRNSADFEESSFIVGQPTPVLAGLTQAWVDDVMKDGVMLGSRSAILLPESGSASLLQANDNQMPSKGMEMKEQQLIKTGAKVITDSTGVETAEAAKLRFAGQNSKLSLTVNNVERAVLQSFQWVAEFMPGGDAGENSLSINRQFYEATVNPQLIVANMQLLDRGVIAKSDLRNMQRKAGQIEVDRTDEDIDAELGNADPLI